MGKRKRVAGVNDVLALFDDLLVGTFICGTRRVG